MTPLIRYDTFVEDALRGVVRRTLETVAEDGLPGNHHLYITFRTSAPGVDIADFLVAKYPEEMTIVLQHKFWGLEVLEDHFAVTLSFNKHHERLVVPFAALTGFADPSVNFGLQFKGESADGTAKLGMSDELAETKTEDQQGGDQPTSDLEIAEDGDAASGDDNVVALDAFRKR